VLAVSSNAILSISELFSPMKKISSRACGLDAQLFKLWGCESE
jgi:hypothetical protein